MSISRGGDAVNGKPISIGEPDMVTSWPFKEPEKKSAWDNERKDPVKDIPITLVDHELEKAKRRTAELRALMSPAGALGLPALLDAVVPANDDDVFRRGLRRDAQYGLLGHHVPLDRWVWSANDARIWSRFMFWNPG